MPATSDTPSYTDPQVRRARASDEERPYRPARFSDQPWTDQAHHRWSGASRIGVSGGPDARSASQLVGWHPACTGRTHHLRG
jgi:hypothetical protein